jgi:RNA polymerase primary sigma factor
MHELALRQARLPESRPPAPSRTSLRVVSSPRGLDPRLRPLVAAHRPLVISMAKRHGGRGAWLDDLIQEGSVGLIKAAQHFDPQKGTRFGTYAKWWIRAYINRCPPDGTGRTVREGGDVSWLERLADESVDLEREYEGRERDRDVHAVLQRLRKRLGGLGWDIVHARLCKDPPETLDEIARRWSLSRERVRQIEFRTKQLLASHLAPLATC